MFSMTGNLMACTKTKSPHEYYTLCHVFLAVVFDFTFTQTSGSYRLILSVLFDTEKNGNSGCNLVAILSNYIRS